MTVKHHSNLLSPCYRPVSKLTFGPLSNTNIHSPLSTVNAYSFGKRKLHASGFKMGAVSVYYRGRYQVIPKLLAFRGAGHAL